MNTPVTTLGNKRLLIDKTLKNMGVKKFKCVVTDVTLNRVDVAYNYEY